MSFAGAGFYLVRAGRSKQAVWAPADLNMAVREGLIKQPCRLFDPTGFALARSF